jgi:hypothetical protein
MRRFRAYSVFLLVLCIGCQKISDFPETGNNKKTLVIEAIITNQPDHQKVRVSYTTQFDDSQSSQPITSALVKISDTTGDTVSFQYSENGWYTSNGFVALPENNYTLLVQIDTTIYRATSMMLPMHGLDSLSYSFYRKANTPDSAYYLKIFAGITDPSNPKYCQLQIYKNHKLITSGSNTLLLSDISTLSLNGIELDQSFAKNDTLDVELYSLTREMFYYYIYVFNIILYNSNYDLEFKTNPPIQFSPKALGYFQVSALSVKSIIIR